MGKVLTDGVAHDQLLPLTYLRAVADLRIGILTFRERWELHTGEPHGVRTKEYLQHLYESATGDEIAANSLPNGTTIDHVWDFFRKNGEAIEFDYELVTRGRTSAMLDSSNTQIGDQVFIEPGAKVSASILNSETGPIYIGKDAEVMEGCMIRGPFALGEGAVLKMGAKIYGPTTIGPYSKVGGEVNNCVIMGYSNKAHDGFIGNSVIGLWCNLGADTNTSNLKNNYGSVKVWDYTARRLVDSGLQFCGLIMGDHSKSGINTMFNTGTVVGVNANVFDSGFPPKFIPSFTWGQGQGEYQVDKAVDVASKVMERRGVTLTDADRDLLVHVFDWTSRYRSTDNSA